MQGEAAGTGRRVQWGSVGLYLVLAFGLSWSAWLGLRALGVPFTVRVAVGMFGPAAAAAFTRWLRQEGFADAGLRLSRSGAFDLTYVLGWLVPPAVLAAGLVLTLALGVQHWALADNLRGLLVSLPAGRRRALGQSTLELLFAAEVVAAFTAAPFFNGLFAFGEELGWRGHLLPRLLPLGGGPAALVVGVVWGLWHAPVVVLDGYDFPGRPLLGVLGMVLFTSAWSFILAWLRLRSGSLWPGALAHGALNAQAGLVALALSRTDPLLAAPVGLLGVVPAVLLAAWLVASGRLPWGFAQAR